MTTFEYIEAANRQSRPITILLIEDDPNDALILHHVLQYSGLHFSVLHQRDGAEALEYLQTLTVPVAAFRPQLPDVIILDLKMPRVSGLELLQWIRSQIHFRDIPVLVLTGSTLPEDRELCRCYGADEILHKTADHSDLTSKLVHFLRGSIGVARCD